MTIRVLAAAVMLCVAVACASNPKAKVVTAYQSVEIGLGALQDAERAAYAAGTIPALTKVVHEQTVSPAFVKAFDMQIRFGNALLLWKPGTTMPVGYDQWVAAVENVAAVLREVSPRNSALFDATLSFVRAAIEAIKGFGQQPTPVLLSVAASGEGSAR